MRKLAFILLTATLIVSCKSLSSGGGGKNKVTEEKLKDYIGEELSVLNDDFKVESCQFKIAYFKDVYAVKIMLKNEQEIVVILKEKIELPKEEIEQGCNNEKLKSGVISKIRFYKDGQEILVEE